MVILGLGGLLSDPACAVLRDGELKAAVEQKKLARKVKPGELPLDSIQVALELARVTSEQVDTVALARPFHERGDATVHLKLREMFPSSRVLLMEHHRAHAASAFFASAFEEATVLTLDRAGDFRCGARWHGRGNQLLLERDLNYPDSLGDLYGRVTQLLGYEPNAEEHKVQWLSTAAEPDLAPLFREILPAKHAGWPQLDRSYVNGDRLGRGGFSAKFYARLGLEDEALVPPKMQARIAAGIQRATEDLVLDLAGDGENLCVAGGLLYNALLVARLERSGRWKRVFVQPVAGNAGTALGAALHAWHQVHGQTSRVAFDTLALGPAFVGEQIKEVLENCKLRFKYLLTSDELISTTVDRLGGDQIVAWMQGRMEFGPRALGYRSILASPLNPYSTENLNIYIKRREAYRKFAASVPEERAGEFFEVGGNARFLATVGRVRPEYRKRFESAVLGDGWVRVHTVSRDENPLYHRLLTEWGAKTGLPVLYNTSFNLFGDPLVCTPRDAVRSFYSSGVDSMLVGNFLLEK